MNKLNSVKIKSKLYLTKIELSDSTEKINEHVSTNHVFCCDVSGSMWNSLPLMRNHLKNKIPDIVNKNDTVTIIAFSGRNECTELKELVKVNDLQSLKSLNDAIDRYMVPMDCTCFYDPVVMTMGLIRDNPGNYNFIFLSDGGNNDCPWSDVVAALAELDNSVGSSTIIEYGYYADTQKLDEMALILGGAHITASEFSSYIPVFEKAITRKSVNKKVVDISNIKDDLKYQRFIYLSNSQINVVSSKGLSEIKIPEDVTELYCLTTEEFKSLSKEVPLCAAYAMAYVCAGEFQYDMTENILSYIGDTKFIDLYCNAFGKQKLFDFRSSLSAATFDVTERGSTKIGYKSNPNAYCVFDFIDDLISDRNYLRVASDDFNYNRIGAKSVVKNELTEDQKIELASAKTKKDLDKIVDELSNNEVKVTKIDNGYPLSDFTWNEDRANFSALLKIDVELELPENKFGLTKINSFIFRNYTLIKDGILNVTQLPLILTLSTYNKLKKKSSLKFIKSEYNDSDGKGYIRAIIDISDLPVINKKLTKSVKCSEMTDKALNLMEHKFALKYLKYLQKNKCTFTEKVAKGCKYFSDYDTSQWLLGLGLTEDGGYSPKTEVQKSGDYYMALTFKSNFNSFSSIPKIEDVLKKINSGKKLTPSETFMKNVMDVIDVKLAKLKENTDEEVAINKLIVLITEDKLNVARTLAKMKFALILSRKWFSDRKGFDDNHAEIDDGFGNTLTIDYSFTETKQYL